MTSGEEYANHDESMFKKPGPSDAREASRTPEFIGPPRHPYGEAKTEPRASEDFTSHDDEHKNRDDANKRHEDGVGNKASICSEAPQKENKGQKGKASMQRSAPTTRKQTKGTAWKSQPTRRGQARK